MKPSLDRALLIAALLLACAGTTAVFLIVPEFSAALASFGNDLPLLSLVTLRFYPASILFPPAVLCVWRFWPWRSFRSVAAVALGTFIAVAAPVVTLVAMYWPVYALGAA